MDNPYQDRAMASWVCRERRGWEGFIIVRAI